MTVTDLARRLLANKALFLDTETTGLSSADQVVEIAIVDGTGAALLDTLVRPTIPISVDAITVHGITEQDVANAPSFADIYPQLQAIVNNRIIVVYNANYDMKIIAQSAQVYGLAVNFGQEVYCAMEMYAEFCGDWNNSRGNFRWHRLEVAAKQCGIVMASSLHRARTDADLTRKVVTFVAESERYSR